MTDLGVFVVDGHESFRRAVTAVVEAAAGLRLEGSASSGADALDAVDAASAVDLLVIDVDLPDGVTVASELCRRRPGLVVLYTSILRADDLPVELLERTEHAASVRSITKAAFDADQLTSVDARHDAVVYPRRDAGRARGTAQHPR